MVLDLEVGLVPVVGGIWHYHKIHSSVCNSYYFQFLPVFVEQARDHCTVNACSIDNTQNTLENVATSHPCHNNNTELKRLFSRNELPGMVNGKFVSRCSIIVI